MGNLPDNVSENDPRAPWNQPDSPWDTDALDNEDFECDTCGFSLTGAQVVGLDWDEPSVVLAGRPVHECPACVLDAVKVVGRGPFTEKTKVGLLLMPHVCGVTERWCSCAADDEADRRYEQEREEAHV